MTLTPLMLFRHLARQCRFKPACDVDVGQLLFLELGVLFQ